MGASAAGHAANAWTDAAALVGLDNQAFRFEGAARAVMKLHNIDSWNARGLVREKLTRQMELAQKSPLRFIKIQDGLAFLKMKLDEGFWARSLSKVGIMQITKQQFVDLCWDMIRTQPDYRGNYIRFMPQDRLDLFDIFDAVDFDQEGTLCRGELAGACSVLFRGNTEEVIQTVFSILDADNTGSVSGKELQEYLRPFVHAMIPEPARAMQPMLLKRCTDTIFKEMDADHDSGISEKEMLNWTKSGHNIIDSLSDLIDKEVYQAWMENNERSFRYPNSPPPPGSKEEQMKMQQKQNVDPANASGWSAASNAETASPRSSALVEGSPYSSPTTTGVDVSLESAPAMPPARQGAAVPAHLANAMGGAPRPTHGYGGHAQLAPPYAQQQYGGAASPSRSLSPVPPAIPAGVSMGGYAMPGQAVRPNTATMPTTPLQANGLTPPVGLAGMVPGLQPLHAHMQPQVVHTAPNPNAYSNAQPVGQGGYMVPRQPGTAPGAPVRRG